MVQYLPLQGPRCHQLGDEDEHLPVLLVPHLPGVVQLEHVGVLQGLEDGYLVLEASLLTLVVLVLLKRRGRGGEGSGREKGKRGRGEVGGEREGREEGKGRGKGREGEVRGEGSEEGKEGRREKRVGGREEGSTLWHIPHIYMCGMVRHPLLKPSQYKCQQYKQ